jgi:hypothetical protein
MSDNNIAITSTVIEVISVPTSNFITQVIEVHEPIISAAQGPQGIQGVSGATTLATVTDVNMAGLTDGALLVYNAETGFWQPTTVLDKQALECGQY